MKEKIEPRFKKCPRCNNKTFFRAKVCGKCELNFDKFKLATNEEAKIALRKGEKERVLKTKQLPIDVQKWPLFWYTLFLGWTGAHLVKVGLFNRAIFHFMGLLLGAVYFIGFQYVKVNAFVYNLVFFSGAFWLITLCLVIFDVFDIAFNRFKVPVSIPYKEK